MNKKPFLLSPLVLIGSVILEAVHTIAGQAWPGYTLRANWIDIVHQPFWLAAIVLSVFEFVRPDRPSLRAIGIMIAASLLSFSHGVAVRGGESTGSNTYSGLLFMLFGIVSLVGVIGYLKGGAVRAKPIREQKTSSIDSKAA